MEDTSRPRFEIIWLVFLVPAVLCLAALLVGGIVGTAYYLNQIQSGDATATQAYAEILQSRATQTAAKAYAQQELATETAAVAAQQTAESQAATATPAFATAQAQATRTAEVQLNRTTTLTLTPTATRRPPVGGGGSGQGTVVFQECRGYEGSLTFSDNPAQSLHAYASITYIVPPGIYRLKVEWLGHQAENYNGTIEIRSGTQIVPFGDQCR